MKKTSARTVSWGILAGALVFFWMIIFNLRQIRDPDIWWHLGSGRYIAAQHAVPTTDIFSFTAKGSAWVDTYWLQDLAIYLLYQAGGIPGLTLANAVLIAFLVFLAIGFINGLSWETKLFGIAWLFLAGHPRDFGWGEKASIVTFGFLAILFYAIREKRSRWLPWWPLLFALWANLHRGFILGLALLGIHVLAEALQDSKNRARLLGGWAACAAATLLNPYGYRVYGMGWTDFRLSPVNVTGWAQTPFGHLELFWITLVIFWLILAWTTWKDKALGWGFLGISAVLSVLSMRYASLYPYFLLWAIPWLLPVFARHTAFFKSRLVLPLAAAMILISSLHLRPAFGANPRIFPVDAVQFLKANHWQAPFYHEYEFGGYYLWTLGGHPPVMIDGRYPAVQGYQILFGDMQKAIQGAPEEFHRFMRTLGVHAAVVKYPSLQFLPAPFAVYFPRKNWALIYWDDVVMIFVERLPEFKTVISTNEYCWIEPDADPACWRQTVWSRASPVLKTRIRSDLMRNAREHPRSRRAARWLGIISP